MTEPKKTGSAASNLARQQMNDSYMNQNLLDPPYDPRDPVNRAKRGDDVPAPGSDAGNPNGVATVNGASGRDGGDTHTTTTGGAGSAVSDTLPDSLTAQARSALNGDGVHSLKDSYLKTDVELIAITGVGQGTVDALRAAERAAGLRTE